MTKSILQHFLSCFSSQRLIFYNQISNNDWFFNVLFHIECHSLYMQQIEFVLNFWYWQTTRGQKSTRRKWMLHYFSNVWLYSTPISCHLLLVEKISYSLCAKCLSLHEFYNFLYFKSEQNFICIIFRYSAPREPPKPRYRKPLPKPKYDMNGNAPNGIPMQTMVPNGIMGTPHGTQRSTRSKHIGSHRGAPGPLRFSVAPPGLYRSMMAPYFMQPPYQQIIYIDESDDDDENSVRSTMREHKKRYRRSYFSTSKDPSSKIEIKYV